MIVEVDAARCVAAGQCVLLAPRVFDQDDDGIAFVLDGETSPDDASSVEESVRLCPASAITLVSERQ